MLCPSPATRATCIQPAPPPPAISKSDAFLRHTRRHKVFLPRLQHSVRVRGQQRCGANNLNLWCECNVTAFELWQASATRTLIASYAPLFRLAKPQCAVHTLLSLNSVLTHALACSCQALSGATSPQLYYRAICSNSNANPHAVTFYTDSACSSVATSAAPAVPGTSAGTMAALEYPCVKISDSSSVSAGAFNDALYGIGSALLWTRSSTCQGLTNAVGNVVGCPAKRATKTKALVCCVCSR